MNNSLLKQNKKYGLMIFVLLLAFMSFKDRFLNMDTSIFSIVCIAFVSFAAYLAYLKFNADKKSGTVNYKRIAIAGLFIAWTIGYGIYDYITFPY